jgi:hypothetical protein
MKLLLVMEAVMVISIKMLNIIIVVKRTNHLVIVPVLLIVVVVIARAVVKELMRTGKMDVFTHQIVALVTILLKSNHYNKKSPQLRGDFFIMDSNIKALG